MGHQFFMFHPSLLGNVVHINDGIATREMLLMKRLDCYVLLMLFRRHVVVLLSYLMETRLPHLLQRLGSFQPLAVSKSFS